MDSNYRPKTDEQRARLERAYEKLQGITEASWLGGA